jgi:DNA-binding NtrC family response regulator
MTDRALERCHILLVEDEYLLADELATELADRGATVLGPVPNVKSALALIDGDGPLHGAILDVNLGGEPAFPVADNLVERGVPVIFTTGYDAAALPERFRHLPRCEKPVSIARITATLSRAMHG